MDIANYMLTPVTIAMGIGGIGLVGVLMALSAAMQIDRELKALKRGRNALNDLPMSQAVTFSYRDWIDKHGPQLANSHFGDHLLAAVNTSKSARAVTLHELHEVSARREARRFAARLSGGITALLLVCGIAGTLLAIEPLLGGFDLIPNLDGTIEASTTIDTATNLIKGLSKAFLPSLVALLGTILVAVFRGWYAHRRGILAGELDKLDLEDLFPRFPPPSLSQELNDVRAQLAELTTRMLASQQDLDSFVLGLSGAAKGFHADAPLVQQSSRQFADGVKDLSPQIRSLNQAIEKQFGAASPLVQQLHPLPVVAEQVSKAASQMQLAGAVMSKHLQESHVLLRDTVGGLSSELQAACNGASRIIADAAAKAISDACSTAVKRIDEAAQPIAAAATTIAEEHRLLRQDTSKSIATLSEAVHDLMETHAQQMQSSLDNGFDDLRKQLQSRLDAAGRGFNEALDDVPAEMRALHSQAQNALAEVARQIGRLEETKAAIMSALTSATEVRDGVSGAREEVLASIKMLGSRLDETSLAFSEVHRGSRETGQQLSQLLAELSQTNANAASLDQTLRDILKTQRQTKQRADTLAAMAEEMPADWDRWLSETGRASKTEGLRGEIPQRLRKQAELISQQLADSAKQATDGHQQLAKDLETLTTSLKRLEKLAAGSLWRRIFRRRG